MSDPIWSAAPWRTAPFETDPNSFSVLDAKGGTVAEVIAIHARPNARPDADLIAAAPRLFRALRRFVRDRPCYRIRRGLPKDCAAADARPCRVCAGRAALAAAGGK